MLVALFDSELLCSPPSNRATKRLACVGFVWQADMGDEYDIIIITTTPPPAAAATATTTTTRSINVPRVYVSRGFRALCALCASAFCAGSARVVLRGFRACSRIQISSRNLYITTNITTVLGNLYIITLGTLRIFTWKTWEP